MEGVGGQTCLLAASLAEQNPGGEGEGAAWRVGREGVPGPPGRSEAPGPMAEGSAFGEQTHCSPL